MSLKVIRMDEKIKFEMINDDEFFNDKNVEEEIIDLSTYDDDDDYPDDDNSDDGSVNEE